MQATGQVWERVSSLAKVMLFQKTFTKELIFVALSLALFVENLSSMDLEKWLVVSEKSLNFIFVISGNPVIVGGEDAAVFHDPAPPHPTPLNQTNKDAFSPESVLPKGRGEVAERCQLIIFFEVNSVHVMEWYRFLE